MVDVRVESSAVLGDDLAALVRGVGSALVRVDAIATLPGRDNHGRAAFRLDFADGRRLKGRRLASAEQAATVERVLLSLRLNPLPRPLARRGVALLEPWIEGSPWVAQEPTAARLRACGALLGRIHGHDTVSDTAVIARRHTRLGVVLDELVGMGALMAAERSLIAATADRMAPTVTRFGIVHGDFCAENMVVTANRALRLIDNEAMALDAVDYDLARVWYRWPLRHEDAAVMLQGYGMHGDPRPFLRHFAFWAACALADAAAFRLSVAAATAHAPLDRLHQLARHPANPPWGMTQ